MIWASNDKTNIKTMHIFGTSWTHLATCQEQLLQYQAVQLFFVLQPETNILKQIGIKYQK